MAGPNGGQPPARKFPVTWLSDAKLDLNSRYLVKGLIEQGSFSVIYGPSGSGKSFFTADIAQHIALGQVWRGRKVNQSVVVYVASEAGGSILKRFIGWRDNRLGEASERIPLAILTRGPSLLVKQDVAVLAEQMLELEQQSQLPIGWIVFDTLSRSIPGGDENKAEDMTEAVSVADYLRDTFKASTAFVHHSGKDVEKGARGHSSLFAAADCVLRVSERVAAVEKVRDGVAGETFPFSLQPVDLGEDQDGDLITTCILSHDGTAMPAKPVKGIGANQRFILKQLETLIGVSGERSPGSSAIPAGVLTVRFDALAEACKSKFPGQEAWRVKQRLSSALIGLQSSGAVSVHNEFVWLVHRST